MKKQTLYNIVTKAMKGADPENKNYCCNNCFVNKLQKELNKTDINYDYYNGSDCSNPLFYLEDLGIIKILSGIPDRESGVLCNKLRIKILNSYGNKI